MIQRSPFTQARVCSQTLNPQGQRTNPSQETLGQAREAPCCEWHWPSSGQSLGRWEDIRSGWGTLGDSQQLLTSTDVF